MPGYTLGSFRFSGQTWSGRVLDGRKHGEQISVPCMADQVASDQFLLLESDVERFCGMALGTVAPGANGDQALSVEKHFLFRKLVVVEANARPWVPGKNDTFDGLGDVGGGIIPAGGGFIEPPTQSTYSPRYKLWIVELRYGEDRGWEEEWRGSVKMAVLDVLFNTTAPVKPYTQKLSYPFPESNLSMTNKRVARDMDPGEVISQYGGKVNDGNWKLPGGRIVNDGCALYLTTHSVKHKQTYGPQLWSVTHDFLVQNISWNKAVDRAGVTSNLTLGTTSDPLFAPIDFTPLFPEA